MDTTDTALEDKKAAVKSADRGVKQTEAFSGLCSTCNDAPTCVQALKAMQPILFCDMFDDHCPPAQSRQADVETAAISAPLREEAEPLAMKGLCQNCDHRHDCALPRPETGVWHCEEYA